MLILKLTSPAGEVRYVTGAFPSACGKTNLAMLVPTMPGWKVETIGDDICWMKIGPDGTLRAINPEAGFFGVAPGTNMDDQPERGAHARRPTASSRTRRSPTTATSGGRGSPRSRPTHCTDWRGKDWTPQSATPAAHPNSRFTAPASQDPAIAAEWEDPAGVPISAILFGGRRASVVPLVHEAFDWAHGVFLGLDHGLGDDGRRRRARSASCGATRSRCCPFCGYNMADYWAHWLSFRDRMDEAKLPRIFYVNWFRKAADGRFLWPGFGENSRVLEWVFERCAGRGEAVETPIGYLPGTRARSTSRASTSPRRT